MRISEENPTYHEAYDDHVVTDPGRIRPARGDSMPGAWS